MTQRAPSPPSNPRLRRRSRIRSNALCGAIALALCGAFAPASGCTPTAADTIDLGDNFEAPELTLDDNFFYCEIQPNVLSASSCAEGGSGDGGGCHAARSALRLIPVHDAPTCQDGRLIGTPLPDAEVNLEHVRSSVGIDAESSPLYRRPLGLDSHPRQIFNEQSPEAALLRQWLSGAM